jgi:hypothetical protein
MKKSTAVAATKMTMMANTKRRSHHLPALYKLLSYRRAHNSVGEKQYVLEQIQPLQPRLIATPENEVMAFFVYVGKSNIMFTSHVDTVHMNVAHVFQDVVLKDGLYCKEDSQPLGADDAAGNWLMFNMIANRIPGVYAFFRGEERGGIGSSFCAKHRLDLFEGIECAIAFDRRGTQSIITHQGRGRGCSDEFGMSLAHILNMGHKLDPTGIYTDTAEFFDIVPNCTNISVGYENEHSKKETLNKAHIEALRDALLVANWKGLDFTPPIPDPVTPDIRGYMDFGIPDHLFEPINTIGPTDIADYVFDHCECLPRDLRDKALELSQRIYKRFE